MFLRHDAVRLVFASDCAHGVGSRLGRACEETQDPWSRSVDDRRSKNAVGLLPFGDRLTVGVGCADALRFDVDLRWIRDDCSELCRDRVGVVVEDADVATATG